MGQGQAGAQETDGRNDHAAELAGRCVRASSLLSLVRFPPATKKVPSRLRSSCKTRPTSEMSSYLFPLVILTFRPSVRISPLPDSYSAFATAVGTTEVDELASPPPAAPSNLAAATAAFAHPARPSLESRGDSSTSSVVAPKMEPNLNPPVLPPLPAVATSSAAPLAPSAPPAASPAPSTGAGREVPAAVPLEEEMQVDNVGGASEATTGADAGAGTVLGGEAVAGIASV